MEYLFPIPKLPEEGVQPALLQAPPLHRSFESWFIMMVRTNQLSRTEKFCIIDLEAEYKRLCWKENNLWEKWRKNVEG